MLFELKQLWTLWKKHNKKQKHKNYFEYKAEVFAKLQSFVMLVCCCWIKYSSTGPGHSHIVVLTNRLLLQSVSVDFLATSFADSASWNKSPATGIVSYPHV